MSSSPSGKLFPAVEIFANLSPAEQAELAGRFEQRLLRRGEILVAQGEPAEALFIVVSGRFSVTVAGRPAPVSEIGPGQPIGEIAFLAGGNRTATVTALRDSIVFTLDRDAFERLSSAHPAIWRALSITLAQRVAATNTRRAPPPDPRPRTIAVIRAGQSAVPNGFLERLTAAFLASTRTHVVTAESLKAALPAQAEFESQAATEALNALESHSDYVLMIADDERTAWSEKAIRHADAVLMIAGHASDSAPNPLERLAADLLPPAATRLVLVHPTRTRLSGTSRWLDRRHVAMHHHVALDNPADMERLLRFVTGAARGLVACGGGALCAAHVGIYKALIEAGIDFDIMGGTSAGSAMSAAFALGTPPDDIDRAIHDIFIDNKAMSRFTWPRYGLLDHRNFDLQLARYFGGIDIEDLWTPFFAVSTNLSSYQLHVHRRGNLWSAVRASASIPVLLPPIYTDDGQMLADGCLLDNVPVRVMHDLKSGPNAVVSFALPEMERFDVEYATLPSRSSYVRQAINPLARHTLPDAPGIAAVLMRSLMANRHDYKRRLRPQDLLLVPPMPEGMSFLDWSRHTELVAAAYRWGRDELARVAAAGGHPLLAAARSPTETAGSG